MRTMGSDWKVALFLLIWPVPAVPFLSQTPLIRGTRFPFVVVGQQVPLCRGSMMVRMSDVSDDSATLNEVGANEDDAQRHLRFSGIGRLYVRDQDRESATQRGAETNGDASPHLAVVDRLATSTVAVVGLGGVGSWAAEALCRSGVGNIILIDLDDICISNTNRQLHAMTSTVGKMKIDEMRSRLLDINPHCNVTNIYDFVTNENVGSIVDGLLPELTVCLDAIDGQYEKTALIAACAERGVPIVTCGGAAGRSDPTKVLCDDLTRASDDRLLFWCRKKLRQKYNFEKGPAVLKERNFKPRKWGISAVFSSELQKAVPKDEAGSSSLRRCDGALGTACFVTGTYGFVAAGRVVAMIATGDLIKPSLNKMKYN